MIVQVFVLGIDPGLSRCGYCVLDASGADVRARAMGVLSTPPEDPVPRRLATLQGDIVELIEEFEPQAVAIERVLFQVNVRTAMSVGQASGIVMAAAAGRGCAVVEYSPNQVKEAVAGYGSADKSQVQEMVRRLLGLSRVPRPPDAADAAAVAWCHLSHSSTERALAAGEERTRSRRPVGHAG